MVEVRVEEGADARRGRGTLTAPLDAVDPDAS